MDQTTDVKTQLKQIISRVCDQIDRKIDEDANEMIERVIEKIKRLAQSNKDEVKIQFQELNFGMKTFEVDKVEQVSKKIHKTLCKKMDRLKEHVSDFIEFKLDSIVDERTTQEKSKRREELGINGIYQNDKEKITTTVGNRKIYTCPICVKQFYSLPHLNTHLKSDHGTKFFQNLSCSICGQLFENGRSLAHHIWAQHTEKKYIQSFQCGGCSSNFTEKVLLAQHVTDCPEYSTVSDNILEYKRRKGANQLEKDKERESKQILI